MFIQQTLDVIEVFLDRFVPFCNEQGDYTSIKTEGGKVCFTFNDDYRLFAWIENEELHVENENGESVFDYAAEHGWSAFEVSYMKYGRNHGM